MRHIAAGFRIGLLLLASAVLLAAGCSDTADSATQPTTDSGSVDTQPAEDTVSADSADAVVDTDAVAVTDAAVDTSPPDAGAPAPNRVCLPPCNDASDCGQDGPALYDSSHYACLDGVCRFQGCRSDTECAEAIDQDHDCDESLATPQCRRTCQSPGDCALASSELNGTDNYACVDGFCEWLGCNSDQECIDDIGDGHICMAEDSTDRLAIASCAKACATVSDCGTPTDLYDEDNYVCEAGGCLWTGCNDDDECMGLVNVDLVCR